MELTREQALVLLKKYNKESFHIQHALTVEGVMRWFAQENGEDADFWGLCGLAEKFGEAAENTAILYGGSCKPSNAEEIFAKANVDGGLIGGAALKAEDFIAIGKGF